MIKFNTADILLFKWETLHYLEYKNEISFEAINQIIKSQENSVSFLKTNLAQKIEGDNYLESLSEKEKGDYIDQIHGTEIVALSEFKRIQNYNILQILISTLEFKLKEICDLVVEEFNLGSLPTIGYLNGYWRYLKDTYGIDTNELDADYVTIDNLKYLRNKVVHNNGILNDNNIQFVDETEGLSYTVFEDIHTLEISRDYLSEIVILSAKFLQLVLKKVEERFRMLRNI